jgi:hypothetical protein
LGGILALTWGALAFGVAATSGGGGVRSERRRQDAGATGGHDQIVRTWGAAVLSLYMAELRLAMVVGCGAG